MGEHLGPRLSVGSLVGDHGIIAVLPHAFRPETWVVVGQRDDGSYATWTTSGGIQSHMTFWDIANALADMMRRARS